MVTIKDAGRIDGQTVREATLEDGDASLSVLSYGCVTRDWRVPVGDRRIPVVLGFPNVEHYPEHSRSFGIIAGRVANRTALGRFTLAGMTYQLPVNNGPNHLHGGIKGLGRRIWSLEADTAGKSVLLTYHSPDGEEGYPGAVEFEVRISFMDGRVTYDMTGTPDRVTPINLAQHNYYNLNGAGDVLAHRMQLAAPQYTPVDATLIPTGEIASVAGTHMDFRAPSDIGALDPSRKGIDLNLVLDPDRDRHAPAATVESAESGLTLKLWTDEPGVQVFNAPEMNLAVPGHDGVTYGPFGGLCLEAQHFPDALNQTQFPPILSSPDQPYRQKLVVEIR